jgi:TM2 domain-containing membrane protein YozV
MTAPLVAPVPTTHVSPARGRRASSRTFAEGKAPGLAVFLSFLLVGMGQFYNGDIKKGFFMLAGGVLGLVLTAGILYFVLWVWSMIDACRVAGRSIPLWT